MIEGMAEVSRGGQAKLQAMITATVQLSEPSDSAGPTLRVRIDGGDAHKRWPLCEKRPVVRTGASAETLPVARSEAVRQYFRAATARCVVFVGVHARCHNC